MELLLDPLVFLQISAYCFMGLYALNAALYAWKCHEKRNNWLYKLSR